MILYHVTSQKNLPNILEKGMNPHSYWTSDENILSYYEETIRDEGEKPVVITLMLDTLDAKHCSPDYPGLEEPISTVLGMDEDEIWELWEESSMDWNASLEIIGSIRYDSHIPANLLSAKIKKNALSM